MVDSRRKASMPQIMVDIRPYTTEHFMAESTVQEQDIPIICQILLSKYINVTLLQGLTDNKPYFKIQVKNLFSTDEKIFKIVKSKKTKSVTERKNNRNWVDELEEMDAALDDN